MNCVLRFGRANPQPWLGCWDYLPLGVRRAGRRPLCAMRGYMCLHVLRACCPAQVTGLLRSQQFPEFVKELRFRCGCLLGPRACGISGCIHLSLSS